MTLLDISQSEYLFKQGKQLSVVEALICSALVIYAIICFQKGRKSGDEGKRKAENFRAIVLTLFSLAIWFFGLMPATKNSSKLK